MRIGRTVIALGVVSLLNDAASEMILPLLPAFLVMLPGGGVAILGVMEGFAESLSAVLKLGSGWASDRTSRPRNRSLRTPVRLSCCQAQSIVFSRISALSSLASSASITENVGSRPSWKKCSVIIRLQNE